VAIGSEFRGVVIASRLMLWAKAIEVDSVSCAIDFGRKLADIILDKL
jgi:hypothetical protein